MCFCVCRVCMCMLVSEDCNRGREGGRVGRNSNNSRGRRFRTFFFTKLILKGVYSYWE